MTKFKIYEELIKEKKDTEEQIRLFREELEHTTDVTTCEMLNASIEYAKGYWYAIVKTMDMFIK